MYDVKPDTKIISRRVRIIGTYIDLLDGLTSPVPGEGAARLVSAINGPIDVSDPTPRPTTAKISRVQWDSMVSAICFGYVKAMAYRLGDVTTVPRTEGTDPMLGVSADDNQYFPPHLASEVLSFLMRGIYGDRESVRKELFGLSEQSCMFLQAAMRQFDACPANPPTPLLYKTMCGRVDDIIGSLIGRGSYQEIALPLLKIYYAAAKIGTGDLSISKCIPLPEVGQLLRSVRITDATVAILPTPGVDMICDYAELDAPVISTRALAYVSAITEDDLG